MTQPQDKMRAEFEAHMLNLKPCAHLGRQKEVFGGTYRTITIQRNWELWQASCAQQSAQSQQDALDAARYRWLRDRSSTRDGMTDCQAVARFVGFTQFPTLTMESRLHDPDAAIDALIATQGASNV